MRKKIKKIFWLTFRFEYCVLSSYERENIFTLKNSDAKYFGLQNQLNSNWMRIIRILFVLLSINLSASMHLFYSIKELDIFRKSLNEAFFHQRKYLSFIRFQFENTF